MPDSPRRPLPHGRLPLSRNEASDVSDGQYDLDLAAAQRLAAAHPGGSIALVAYGGVLDTLYRAATRIALDAPRSWRSGNAAINRLLYGSSGFTLVGWDDDAHLQAGPG